MYISDLYIYIYIYSGLVRFYSPVFPLGGFREGILEPYTPELLWFRM